MNQIYKDKKDLIFRLIEKNDVVLDVGFWGQGINRNDNDWPHLILKKQAQKVFGLDFEFDETKLDDRQNYKKGSAENFDFGFKFDVIFAADLIEHLSNPGLFLASCARNLKDNGRLILTTPNCFNLFHLAEKISKSEPTVNADHTCYFNYKTLTKLLEKNGWQVTEIDYLYSLHSKYKESWKKVFLNFLYWILAKITNKYLETLVVIAKK